MLIARYLVLKKSRTRRSGDKRREIVTTFCDKRKISLAEYKATDLNHIVYLLFSHHERPLSNPC